MNGRRLATSMADAGIVLLSSLVLVGIFILILITFSPVWAIILSLVFLFAMLTAANYVSRS